MKSKFCFALSALTAVAALSSASAYAQSQGSWLVRGGFMQLAPQVTSGVLSAPSLAGVQTSVSNSTQFAGGITYMVSDNLAMDLPLALPFQHDLYGAGSIGYRVESFSRGGANKSKYCAKMPTDIFKC